MNLVTKTTPDDADPGGRDPQPAAELLPRLTAAVAIGFIAGIITAWLPNAITLGGVPVGDIGPPMVGMQRAIEGSSPYGTTLSSGPTAQYPFTAMVFLAPLLLLPVPLVAPLFAGLSAAILAWVLTAHGQWWRLLTFLSVPFVIALYSVQWSPLFAAALLFPPLLFLAVVKPQLGLVLAAAGQWNRVALGSSAALVALSFLLRPSWPLEWWQSGVMGQFDARVPLLVAPGFLLALSLMFVRTRQGRLLLAMSLVPQRFWYDQLLLFIIPSTWRQMSALLVTSWLGVSWCLANGWDPASGHQPTAIWTVVVVSTYLPALGIVSWQAWRRRALRLAVPARPEENTFEQEDAENKSSSATR